MFMEKKIQKKPSKPASSITGDSSTSTLATMPLTMAAPVGIWFFLLSCANTCGMFCLRAACSATKFTPNDQLTMLPNSVMRNTMPTTMNSTLPTPAMMPTASMMPESSEMSSAGMAARDAERAEQVQRRDGDAAGDDGLRNLLAGVLHGAHVGGDDLEAHEVEQDDGQVREAVRVERRQERGRGHVVREAVVHGVPDAQTAHHHARCPP